MNAFLLAVAWFTQASAEPAAPVEIPFRTVGFGSNAKIKDGGAVVMRTDKAFNDYRKAMGTTAARKPAIDWKKEQLVAVHAAGTGFGGASLQVSKVRQKSDGALEVEAYLDAGSQPATPTPGVVRVLRKEGIYALIVVAQSKGEVTLKVVDPPRDRGDKSGKSGSR